MQYLLIISHDDNFRPDEDLLMNIGDWIRKMEERGVRVCGNPLQPPDTATTVRIPERKIGDNEGPVRQVEGKDVRLRAH